MVKTDGILQSIEYKRKLSLFHFSVLLVKLIRPYFIRYTVAGVHWETPLQMGARNQAFEAFLLKVEAL